MPPKINQVGRLKVAGEFEHDSRSRWGGYQVFEIVAKWVHFRRPNGVMDIARPMTQLRRRMFFNHQVGFLIRKSILDKTDLRR